MTGNKIACALPTSCEMGSPFHTGSALLHAMNHPQKGHQGNITERKEAHSKMEHKENKEQGLNGWRISLSEAYKLTGLGK